MNAPIQKHNHVMKPYACGEKLEGYIYIHMCVYVYVSICVCVCINSVAEARLRMYFISLKFYLVLLHWVRSFDDYMGVGILINKLNCFWNKLTWTIYYLPVTKKISFLSKFFSY